MPRLFCVSIASRVGFGDCPPVQAAALASSLSSPPSAAAASVCGACFMAAARQRGWLAINGKNMLVEQGRAAFALWFGKKPDGSALRAVLED